MLIDGPQPAASVAVLYSDGSVYLVSITGPDSQQQSGVTSLVSAPDEGDACVTAAAVDASGSRLAVILWSAGNTTSAHIHSLQVLASAAYRINTFGNVHRRDAKMHSVRCYTLAVVSEPSSSVIAAVD